MQRRDVLASAGIVLSASASGCLGRFSDDENRGRVRLEEVRPDPQPDVSLTPDVSIKTAAADAQSPARITTRWTNETDDAVTVSGRRQLVFTVQRSDDGSAHLLADQSVWDVSFDDCWHLSGPTGTDGDYPSITLEPGQIHEGTSGLYADDDCLTAGEYRFEISIREHGVPEKTNERGVTDTWGFVLDVATD